MFSNTHKKYIYYSFNNKYYRINTYNKILLRLRSCYNGGGETMIFDTHEMLVNI